MTAGGNRLRIGHAPLSRVVRPAAPVSTPPPARARLEPLSPARYRVQPTVDAELADKPRRARALLQTPGTAGAVDLAQVVDRAVTLLVDRLEARRHGKTTRPRSAVPDPASSARDREKVCRLIPGIHSARSSTRQRRHAGFNPSQSY